MGVNFFSSNAFLGPATGCTPAEFVCKLPNNIMNGDIISEVPIFAFIKMLETSTNLTYVEKCFSSFPKLCKGSSACTADIAG